MPNQKISTRPEPPLTVSSNLDENLAWLQEKFQVAHDVVLREVEDGASGRRLLVAFVEGMSDNMMVQQILLQAIMLLNRTPPTGMALDDLDGLVRQSLPSSKVALMEQRTHVVHQILSGDVALFLDGFPVAVIAATRGFKGRAVEKPDVESGLRGPRDAFNEEIQTNIALIRRRIKDPDLAVETYVIGERTKTVVALLYVKDIASPALVREVKAKLGNIQIDGILDVSYLAQLWQPRWFSPFALTFDTERPDRAVSALLEGRIVLLCDGAPTALIAPIQLSSTFHAAEDFYFLPTIATLLRFLRIFGLAIALLSSPLYVAMTAVTPGMIAESFLANVAATRANVPYPAYLEVLVMELAMNMLNEASARLPRPIGAAATIVGGLVVGEAAARASLISNVMIIVSAISVISLYVIPRFEMAYAWTICRLFLVACTVLFGVFGLMQGLILLAFYLSSLRSFGVPYLAPWAPLQPSSLVTDTVVRKPLFRPWFRPEAIKPQDQDRGRSLPDEAMKEGEA
jgi:spore germination protein KA